MIINIRCYSSAYSTWLIYLDANNIRSKKQYEHLLFVCDTIFAEIVNHRKTMED